MTQPPLFGEPDPEPDPLAPPAPARKQKEPADLTPAPMALLRGKATRCSSCQAAVVWAVTSRTRLGVTRPGRMPVDLDPDPHGNVRLTVEGRTLRAYVLAKAKTAGRGSLHHSHFETCPDAGAWRGKGKDR